MKQDSQGNILTIIDKITISDDINDPTRYLSMALTQWENTEEGKWICDHAVEKRLQWCHVDNFADGTKLYTICAYLSPEDNTYWNLKFR